MAGQIFLKRPDGRGAPFGFWMVGLLEACQTAYDGELTIYRPEVVLFIILLYLLVALFHKS